MVAISKPNIEGSSIEGCHAYQPSNCHKKLCLLLTCHGGSFNNRDKLFVSFVAAWSLKIVVSHHFDFNKTKRQFMKFLRF